MMNTVRLAIDMVCSVDNIPERIVVDLDRLEIGDSIHIHQVQIPEGARPAVHERDFTIATVGASSAVREEAAAAAAAAAVSAAAPPVVEGEQSTPGAYTCSAPGADPGLAPPSSSSH